jgi:hypothetical protein
MRQARLKSDVYDIMSCTTSQNPNGTDEPATAEGA